MSSNAITVRGKGADNDKSERVMYFGRQTAKYLWRYITPRFSSLGNSLLFTSSRTVIEPPMNRNMPGQMLKDLGERVGVKTCTPIVSGTRLLLPICETAAMTSRIKRCLGTLIWR